MDNEENKKRPYPKRFDVAVPANMMCGKISKQNYWPSLKILYQVLFLL